MLSLDLLLINETLYVNFKAFILNNHYLLICFVYFTH